ncbi:multiple epidermal growth factor-like domains protein 10 [Gigantopelta aegis]|uniref:multiple epidermal growth factor-like domains protein 10 n=1 Tax=Gigantopelta aegis TaxID=1735272 RepID=UPI001B887F4A|nr:multiple epidermal growth factor-like domains protein 10 [Gigantopelta aegis]
MSCSSRNCYYTSSGCDQFYGNCTGKCVDGFELPDCATVCRGSNFGSECKFRCGDRHCDGDSTTCDAQSGTCIHGCQPGWKKPSCIKQCIGTYGRDCNYSCSDRKCKDNTVCDHVIGSCNGLCVAGWQGDACNQIVSMSEEISQNDNGSTSIALAVALGIVSILLIALAVVFFWHVRRYKMTPGSTTKENSSVANQDGGHYEIVCRQTGRDRDIARVDTSDESGYVNSSGSRGTDDVSQRPLGDGDSGYVNAGQDIQLNEYEHLDPSHSPQNVYDKITGN